MNTHDRRPPAAYHSRRHAWLQPAEQLPCPKGPHKIKHNAALLQHGALICQHVEPGQRGECGARAYVLHCPGGLRFVAEVTVQEMLHMREKQMSVEQVLAYLQGSAA